MNEYKKSTDNTTPATESVLEHSDISGKTFHQKHTFQAYEPKSETSNKVNDMYLKLNGGKE